MKQKLIYSEKRFTEKGYLEVFIDGVWILEHRYNVEVLLGRKLLKSEVIHHKDFNKINNCPFNLMIFKSQKEHKSFENKVKQFGWTRPLLRIYLNNEIQVKLRELNNEQN